MSKPQYITLMSYVRDIADPRGRQGLRYEWVYVLTVIAGALLAGQQSVRAMAQWAAQNTEELLASLQPKWGSVPSAATLYRALQMIEPSELEQRVGAYVRALDQDDKVTGSIVTATGERLRGQALDGKTVCGASAYGETVHLVSVVRHESGAVLTQTKVATKTSERTIAPQLVADLAVAGTVTTMDALHTSVKFAQQLVNAGGHYLMVVKGNQPTLYADIEFAFQALPPLTPRLAAYWGYQRYETLEKGHGRLERRTLESLTCLNDYIGWPRAAQVLRRTCSTQAGASGPWTHEVHYGLTDLARPLVDTRQLEQLWRWHWTIENRVHYVRDVSLGEDRCQVHTGHAPQVLATFRNAILSLLRYEGWSNLPDAFRFFARFVPKSLHLLGALTS